MQRYLIRASLVGGPFSTTLKTEAVLAVILLQRGQLILLFRLGLQFVSLVSGFDENPPKGLWFAGL